MTKDDASKLSKIGGELWRRSQRDWILSVDHSLTEPTCPTAMISCEDKDAKLPYWRSDQDTIEAAISTVISIAHRELFDGGERDTGAPWTEPTLKWPEEMQ